MEAVDTVLEDWLACKPEGAVLRASNLGEVISRIVARAESLPDSAKRDKAYRYLAPAEAGPPLIVQKLRIDGGHRLSGPSGAAVEAAVAVVHFLCFWQAMDEIWKDGRRPVDASDVEACLVDEVAKFRDGLVASHDSGSITVGGLIETLVLARKSSVDQSAWTPLQAKVVRTASRAAAGSSDGADFDAKQAVLDGRARNIQNEQLPIDAVTLLVLPWLQELVADYRRGEKHSRIEAVTKEFGCTTSEACAKLCSSKWNVDTVIRRQRPQAAPTDGYPSAALSSATPSASSSSPPSAGPTSTSSLSGPLASVKAHTAEATGLVSAIRTDSIDDPSVFDAEASLPRLSIAPLARSVIQPETVARPEEVLSESPAAEEAEDEDECQICAQPFSSGHGGKGMAQLTTKCCEQVLCAHCAATLATANGGLRCPFCRKTDRHPALPDNEPEPIFNNMFEAIEHVGRGASRFVKELFGAEPERPRHRPNLRLDVVFRS